MNAGGPAERITRRKETMENDAGENERAPWTPSFITLNGWVDWGEEIVRQCHFKFSCASQTFY